MSKSMGRWLAIVLVGLSAVPCLAKSYSVERLEILATVQGDGSMQVDERLTYRFRGSFRFAYRDIETGQGEAVDSITVAEGSTPYRQSRDEEPGTFKIDENGGRMRITWYYRARDEARTFRFAYTIRGAVQRHPDVGELYYQFVGDEWERPILDVETTVRFAEGVPADSLRAWVHGPLHGTVALPGDGSVGLAVAPLPRQTFWEARVLFPVSAVAAMAVEGNAPRRQAILDQEAEWAEAANRERRLRVERAATRARESERKEALARRLAPLPVVAGLSGLVFWFVLYRRHGRSHRVQTHLPPGQVPSDDPPVIVMALSRIPSAGGEITATLLDLARRGHLVIQEEERVESGWFGRESREKDYSFETTGKSTTDLQKFEQELLSFTLDQVGDGRRFRMSGLKEIAQTRRSKFRRWLTGWRAEVQRVARERHFFESATGAVLFNLAVGLIVAGIGVVVTLVTASTVGIPALVLGGVQLLLSFALRRRSVAGQKLYQEWEAFKKHLLSISRALGPVSLNSQDWERYLVYAVALGIHDKVLPALQLSSRERDFAFPIWYMAVSGGSDADLAGLGTGIATMVNTISTTMSSTTGTGGGASVGGGGGAGGGGGGAG
jgi:uncharacterized membrane protein